MTRIICSYGFLIIIMLLSSVSLQAQKKDEDKKILDKLQDRESEQEGMITIHQDERIDDLINKHIDGNREIKGMNGYRIQIYSGSGTKARKECTRVKAEFDKLFPEIESHMLYIPPYFRLRIGNFRTKAEGFKTYKRVSQIYPQCYFVIEKEMDYPTLEIEKKE